MELYTPLKPEVRPAAETLRAPGDCVQPGHGGHGAGVWVDRNGVGAGQGDIQGRYQGAGQRYLRNQVSIGSLPQMSNDNVA